MIFLFFFFGIKDLSETEMNFIRDGSCQVLHSTDAAGRCILALNTSSDAFLKYKKLIVSEVDQG